MTARQVFLLDAQTVNPTGIEKAFCQKVFFLTI
jgi:hypothetical protein